MKSRCFMVMAGIIASSFGCVEGGGTVTVKPQGEGVTVISQPPTRVGERTSPTPTPVPPDPSNTTPNIPTSPTTSGSGQSINNVSIYCSSDLIGWSAASMVDSPVLKFTFFQKDRTNFYERTEWNKFTDATELKNSLKQKKAVLPIFTNIPDGRDLGSPCVQGDGYELRLLRHLWTFLTVSLDYIGRGFRRGGRDDDHLGIG